jgi:hypothetical protein
VSFGADRFGVRQNHKTPTTEKRTAGGKRAEKMTKKGRQIVCGFVSVPSKSDVQLRIRPLKHGGKLIEAVDKVIELLVLISLSMIICKHIL